MSNSIIDGMGEHFNTTPRPIKLYNKIHDLEEYIVQNVARFCDNCGTRFVKADVVRIKPDAKQNPTIVQDLNNLGNVELVLVTCHNCGKQQALIVSLLDKNVTKMDLFLDIPYHKLQSFIKMGPIQPKEALALHKYVQALRKVSDI